MIDYISFRFKMSVDWIELVIYPARQTNWQTVQRAILTATGKTVQVDTLDQGHLFNKYSQTDRDEWIKLAPAFKFRIQDPARFIDIARIIDQITKNLDCEIYTTITGIEISLDAIGAGADMAAAMYRGLKNPVSTNQRVYRRGKTFKEYTRDATKQTDAALINYLNKGYMIGIGNETDDLYQRGYYKTSDDNGSGNAIQIVPRARLEIRLQGSALPFRTLAELQQFKFSKISRHFKFRRKITRSDQLPVIGKQYEADHALNKIAKDRLQALSRSWPTVGQSTKSVKNAGAFWRHLPASNIPESSDTATRPSPDSQRLEPMLALGASDELREAVLITCVLNGSCRVTPAQGKRPDHTGRTRLGSASLNRVSLSDEQIEKGMWIDD